MTPRKPLPPVITEREGSPLYSAVLGSRTRRGCRALTRNSRLYNWARLRAVELGGGGEVLMEGPELAHEKRNITQPLAPDPAPEVVNLLKVLFLKSLIWG